MINPNRYKALLGGGGAAMRRRYPALVLAMRVRYNRTIDKAA